MTDVKDMTAEELIDKACGTDIWANRVDAYYEALARLRGYEILKEEIQSWKKADEYYDGFGQRSTVQEVLASLQRALQSARAGLVLDLRFGNGHRAASGED